MNKGIAAVIAIAAFAAGIIIGYAVKGGGEKAPAEVVAQGTQGNLTEIIESLDQQVTKIEEALQKVSRKPKLEDQVYNFDTTGAASQGPENAKLTMVVFSDFECPFCEKFAEATRTLHEKYPDDLRIVFMNFPLDEACNPEINRPFHRRACMGTMAAMYAQEQGKFWEMHDFLFNNRGSYNEDSIAAFAASIGLDPAGIKEAMSTMKYKDRVVAESKQLIPTGSRGTPTAFINGKRVASLRWDDLPTVFSFFDELLNPAGSSEPGGGPVIMKKIEGIPTAHVLLPNGMALEDKLKNLVDRLQAVDPSPRPQERPEPKRPDPAKQYSFDLTNSPVAGPDNAKVTLVLFSDFLCPFCYRSHEAIQKIREQYPDQVKVVFKNVANPGHKYSPESHEAAMEAFAQGKFWKMHDLIFENRRDISPDKLRELAQQAGLDMQQYDAAMADHRHRAKLTNDIKQANDASVSATPTVFINGRYLPTASPEAMIDRIKQELEK